MGLLLTGAALEAWRATVRRAGASAAGRILLAFGVLGGAAAVGSGLLLFHPGDFGPRTLSVALVHRVLGIAALGLGIAALLAGGTGAAAPRGPRLALYRGLYLLTALTVGLAGHYGAWVVHGWGAVWTP